jgi:predicted phage terminase large subunit-like protein
VDFETTQDQQVEIPKALLQMLRDKAKRSMYFFAKVVLGYADLVPHVHRPLCQLLQDRSKHRLRIILPRGWFKTTIASISYPLWEAVNDPNVRILLAQNTATNAMAKLSSIRAHVDGNPLFRALFPEVLPDKTCRWTAESLQLKRTEQWPEATFEAVGIGTQVTSRHYDIIIEDDTVAPDLNELGIENIAPTKEDIDQAIGWHRLTFPLLTPDRSVTQGKPVPRILVIGTRWFELDLLSWIGNNETHYFSYVRSCKETGGISDPNGELTFPELFPQSKLDEIKASMGPYMFSCLYLNNPLRSDDMIFKKEWFRWYEIQPENENLVFYTTVDLASDPAKAKQKDRIDYNVVLTSAKDLRTGNIYLIDYWRRRANPGEVIQEIFRHVRRYNPVIVGIESIAYQSTLQYWIEERKRKEKFYFYIEGLTHGTRSKEMRIRGLQPLFAEGKVFFKPHMRELAAELEAFPLGAYDDIADALAMQTSMWAATESEKDRTSKEVAADPLSLDAAIKELHSRAMDNAKADGIIYDVFDRGRKKKIVNSPNFVNSPRMLKRGLHRRSSRTDHAFAN